MSPYDPEIMLLSCHERKLNYAWSICFRCEKPSVLAAHPVLHELSWWCPVCDVYQTVEETSYFVSGPAWAMKRITCGCSQCGRWPDVDQHGIAHHTCDIVDTHADVDTWNELNAPVPASSLPPWRRVWMRVKGEKYV